MTFSPTVDWNKLLSHAARLQATIPNSVLVGGTASALHAGHRFSLDHDHVIHEFEKNYDETLALLGSIPNWKTRRRVKGKLILGDIDRIQAGLRNLRRTAPLETIDLLINGHSLHLPTVPEMLRIKTFLTAERNATRDYLDVAALSEHLGLIDSVKALETMNHLYAAFAGEGGDMLTSVVVNLANPDPFDLTEVNLEEYKGIVPPWNDWQMVTRQCCNLATAVIESGV